MDLVPIVLVAIAAFALLAIASAMLTGIVWAYARKQRWLALPNARSSHTTPTPSSGGIGIAIVLLVTLATLGGRGLLDVHIAIALVGGGILVACVGWLDDRREISPWVRLVTYAVAAVWALFWIGGLDRLDVGFVVLPLGVFGTLLAFLWIVGMSNLYNFMDGIDGFMGAEAVVVGTTLGAIAFAAGAPSVAVAFWVVAAAAFGFLVWNWHPAKIFMGDVGSVLLGFTFATAAVAVEQLEVFPGILVAMPLAIVLVDGGGTTLRRVFRGERWYEAHRTFSYQRAVAAGHRHHTVVLHAMALNVPIIALTVFAFARPSFLVAAFFGACAIVAIPWAWYQWRQPA